MSKSWTKRIALVAMLCMVLTTTDVFAGPGASGGKKKMGFFAKVGAAIQKASKKAAQAVKNAAQKTGQAIKNAAHKTGEAIKNAAHKTGMAIKTAGAKVVNAGMDTAVWAKQKLIGKKNKVWVCGHYDKNGKWIKGHWRKLSSGKPAAGGNSADQSSYGSSEAAGEYTGYPENTDEGMGGDGNSSIENGEVAGGEMGDMPVAGEDPVLPELPAEEAASESEATSQESEQTSQMSEQTAQFDLEKEVSIRTMGMLMNDIVKQSQSINNFKKTANANISYSVEVQEDVNTTYEVREDDASLLARVCVWDLKQHNGNAGKYYKFFLSKMKAMTPQNRALVKDVVEDVRAGIRNYASNASAEEAAEYENRLAEIANY